MKKNKRLFMRVKVIFAVLIMTSISVLQPVVALDESVTKLTFSVDNSQRVGEGSIRVLEGSTTQTAMFLMPQQEYDLEVSLFDLDEEGLKNLELKMWFDETGESVMESRFHDIDDHDGQKSVAIRWNSEEGAILDSGDDDTWELLLEESVIPDVDEILNDLDEDEEIEKDEETQEDIQVKEQSEILEYEFVFRVKIGKVARMTMDASKWQIAFVANDADIYEYHKINSNAGMDMEWYCEVESPEQVQWGNLRAGIDYNDFGSKQRISGIRYIANGDYIEQVRFDNNWNDSQGESEAVLVQDPINDNEFSLKINSIDDLDTAKQIPSDGSFLVTDGVNEPTDHNGTIKDEYHIYIKLSEQFDTGNYTGNITFGIANGI